MPAQPSPVPAPVVPGYVLEELLGSGGSGQVWQARPRGGGPRVAIKVLIRGDAARQEREAALLTELDHPHLVRLHEVVRHESRGGQAQVALVLDLLTGGSLASLLDRRGRLRPGEVVTTVAPVAAALAHAHDRGVVHGDLSPGNIVFTAEGRPVLTDLGTARLMGNTERAEVTPAYVDPVVARGGAPGPASDVFGVAAAAFHALTGIAPWNAADAAGSLSVATDGELPDLALLAPEAPAELIRVIQRGMSPDPHQRGSAAEFALDLRHTCRPEPVRLPIAGVPDAELAGTDRGRRTELTHQVPGRRPRAVHAAPVREGHLARVRARLAARTGTDLDLTLGPGLGTVLGGVVRRLAVVAAVLVAIAAGLAGAAWAGATWGGGAGNPMLAAETTRAPERTPARPQPAREPAREPVPEPVPATATPPAPVPGTRSAEPTAEDTSGPSGGQPTPSDAREPPTPDTRVSDADRTTPPPDDAGWLRVLTELYGRRADAFTTADTRALAGVYPPGTALLDRDAARVQALAEAGQTLSGFSPQVRELLSVTPDADGKVVLRLVDELPGYQLVPIGDPGMTPAQDVPGRGEATVRMVLEQTTAGWRIGDAVVEQ